MKSEGKAYVECIGKASLRCKDMFNDVKSNFINKLSRLSPLTASSDLDVTKQQCWCLQY